MQHLDFETPILELEEKISELQHMSNNDGINIVEEISRLQKKLDKILAQTYTKLTPWQKVQVARHPERPHFKDYVKLMVEDFTELAGDRAYSDDQAIVGGFGRIDGQSVMIIGTEKGNDIESRMKHNFGSAKPEGYRKAQRLMKLADQYGVPLVTLVDTAGAYPGVGAEERGQAEAIAKSMEVSLQLEIPFVSVIVGEGGSGGAIALATANTVNMLEHAVYSVISPEGCASILWRSSDFKEKAAEAQKLTAQDLLSLKVIDKIIPEPLGGAHRDPKKTAQELKKIILQDLYRLNQHSPRDLKLQRRAKFLNMGRTLVR